MLHDPSQPNPYCPCGGLVLLKSKAVHFRADPLAVLTSGAASPVYIDCRKLISFPRIRSMLMVRRRDGDGKGRL